MKKRLLSAALAVCMLFGSAAALPEGFLGESTVITASAAMNTSFYQLSDGTYRLKTCTGTDTSVTLPSTYEGKAVTDVGGVKSTGADSGISVFSRLGMNNTTLTQLVVPSSYKTLSASAFADCTALKSVTLSTGLVKIGDNVFGSDTALTSITIPSTVTSISSTAFNGCTAMTSINVASGNTVYSSSDGVLYNAAKTTLIAVPAGKTSVNIPGTVKTIPSLAFGPKITSVTLNEGTTKLEKWAFINCKNLKSITIPASVTTIANYSVGYYHVNGETTDPDTKISGFVIKGYTGSEAETYAKKNGFTFQAIGTSCTHTWGTNPSWAWSGVSSANATFTCTKCSSKQEVPATITSAVTKAATCMAKGVMTYTAKVTFGGSTYTNQKTADIAIDSNAHSWNTTASWTWNGYSSATAKVTCKLNSGHYKTATASITNKVTKEATCAATGTRTYTAKATINGTTYTDTKTETIPKDTSKHVWGTTASWTWNGYTSATAALTCTKCGNKKTATATITNAVTKAATCAETGIRTYTAKATIDGTTYTATKTETIPKDTSKHVWGTTASWTWNGYTSATAALTCSKCGNKKTATATITNAVTKAATCAATGTRTYTAKATIDGTTYTATKTETIPKDTSKHVWGTTASWSWNGYSSATASLTCSKCGNKKTATATITNAVTKAATCAATGTRTYTAKAIIDGTTYTATKTETIPKDTSKHVWGTTASWTWNGYTSATAALTCTKCGNKKTATATITNAVTKAATCAATGTRTYTAKAIIDGTTYTATKTETIPKDTSKHVWGTTASWTWNGYTSATAALTCTKCGSKKTATATITNAVTKAATCTTAGVRTYTATATINGKKFTDTKTETIPVNSSAHKWGTTPSWTWSSDYKSATLVFTCEYNTAHTQKVTATVTPKTTAATCTAAGKIVYTATATYGGKTYSDSRQTTIAALGHKWGDWEITKQPTETTEGTKVRKCTRAGCKETETGTVPKTSHVHSYTTKKVAATVKTQGYTVKVCSGCGQEKDKVIIPKLSLRIYGDSRYETSMKTADQFRKELGKAFDTVIVASGADYADALSASYLARVNNAPILLVANADSIMNTVTDYIKKNSKSGAKVYIVGGKAAVPAAMDTKLKSAGLKPIRLAGDNRYETNIAVLKEAKVSSQELLIASGLSYADALSGSAVGLPILLVGKTLTDAQVSYLKSLSGKKTTVIGGPGAVSEAAATAVGKCGKTVSRLGGATRYETSLLVAQKYFPSAPTLALAYGLSFPDGLCGGALAMRYGCPLILATSKNTSDAKKYAKSINAENTVTFGGTPLISDDALKTILGK